MFASNTSQVSSDATYIEDVFSTYLYTGNGSTQTITNGIDLAGEGGMVWGKARSQAYNNRLFDTDRGGSNSLISNSTGATSSFSGFITSFNNDGFSIGTAADLNENGTTYASWTFRKQPKFFDVVTWTGDSSIGASRTLTHNLGSVPGCLILKATSASGDWLVSHRATQYPYVDDLYLNLTSAASTYNGSVNDVTSTSFRTALNQSGVTYVAYLFAHNAGGFGLTGTDNVISCGSFTTNSSGNATVDLGWEPQWVMTKVAAPSGAGSGWVIADNMRGFTVSGNNGLIANESSAESSGFNEALTSTGFTKNFNNSGFANLTYIYIAIRRGPMKTPTSGTSVFDADTYSGNGTAGRLITTGFPVDMVIGTRRNDVTTKALTTRLTGASLRTNDTIAEEAARSTFDSNIGNLLTASYPNTSGDSSVQWAWQRAPGFFDVVCYTGTGSAHNETHNLGVVPELIIVKGRSAAFGWATYSATLGIGNYLTLNTVNASGADPGNVLWNNVAPTSTTFSVGTNATVNGSGSTYVAYLFASCPGVSKVGSFTNSGSDVNVDCGFTAGARFILIKRSSGADDWYVYDSARGITTGNDPYLTLNTTAAEVTNSDGIAPLSSGFTLKGSQWNNGTYIFLAIA